MPTFEITEEKITEIVDVLKSEGKPPTVRNVRERLGGGSFSKIQPILKPVLAKKTEELIVAPDRLKPFMKAADEYSSVIETEIAAKTEAKIKRLEDDLATSVQDLKAAEAQTEQLKKDNSDLQEELSKSQATIEILKERVEASEKARDETKGEFLKTAFDKAEYEALKEKQKALEDQTIAFQNNVLAALADITAKLESAPKATPARKPPNKKEPHA